MCREKYCNPLLLDLLKNLQQFISGKRIQSTCWFIQNQHFCSMRQSEEQVTFYLHAFRQFDCTLFLIKMEQIQIISVHFFVPAVIEILHHTSNIFNLLAWIPINSACGITDTFFNSRLISIKCHSKVFDIPLIRVNHIQH